MLRRTLILTPLVCAISLSLEAISLQQVFKACPRVAEFKPGPYALHMTDSEVTVKIDGKLWEIRYVTYSDAKGKARLRPLKEIALAYDELGTQGKPYEVNPVLTTTTWFQTDEMKGDGIYYTISIKPLEVIMDDVEKNPASR